MLLLCSEALHKSCILHCVNAAIHFRGKLTFTTFIDDLTFSAPLDFKEKAPCIIDTIQSDGFRISHDKTNYKTKNPIVTGVIVKNNNLDLPDSYKIKLQNLEGKTEEQKRGLKLYTDKVLNTN